MLNSDTGKEPLLSEKIAQVKALRKLYPNRWMAPFFSKEIGRRFAAGSGLRGPKIYMTLNSIDELPDLSELPQTFVLKPVDGNGNRGVFCILNGRELMDGLPINRKNVLDGFHREESIRKSRVIIEEFVQDFSGEDRIPRDYKFYNFGSRCAFVHVIERNHRKDAKKNRHWFIRQDRSAFPYVFVRSQKHSDDELILPSYFDEMVRVSKDISRRIGSFARVDLYATPTGPVFGELTAFPHGGKSYEPDADRYLGSLWRGYFGASRFDFVKFWRVKFRGH